MIFGDITSIGYLNIIDLDVLILNNEGSETSFEFFFLKYVLTTMLAVLF